MTSTAAPNLDSYADAVATGQLTAWLCEHPQRHVPMGDANPCPPAASPADEQREARERPAAGWTHYYNENAAFPARWIRNLMAAGHIPQGDVDGRSIRDVRAADLRGYGQCHFFAGIGGWPLALSLAGWAADRPVWTGSCPCQPFSDAGDGKGEDDARHLWPAWFPLIRECRPPVVFGEQVASKAALRWLDGVFADLEGEGYACGAADLCAASCGEEAEGWILRGDRLSRERIIVGAPHIRQRLFWVATTGDESWHSTTKQLRGGWDQRLEDRPTRGSEQWSSNLGAATCSPASACRLAHPTRIVGESGQHEPQRGEERRAADWRDRSGDCTVDGLGNADRERQPGRSQPDGAPFGPEQQTPRRADAGGSGAWSDFNVLPCLDGKARRVSAQPGDEPLAHGIPGRVGRISAYGNAIVPLLAAEFIAAFLAAERERGAT